MKKINALFSYESLSIFFVCSLFSLLVTGTTGNMLYSLLFMGKGLSGRSLVIQIIFLSVLFLFYLFIFLAVLRKPSRWVVENPLFSFAFLSIIPLAAYAYMGSFSRFVADDFSSATLAVHKGIIQATVDWYINWSGRYTASFFDSVMGYLPPSAMMWETGIAIVLILAGMILSVCQLLPNAQKWLRLAFSLIISSMIITVSFSIAPDLPQSLYWGQGMRSLIFPLIPASFILGMVIQLTRRQSPNPPVLWLVLISAISLLAGGFGETYVVLQITAFSLFAFMAIFSPCKEMRQRTLPAAFTGLIFSLIAMLIIIMAPGNKIRQSYFPASPDLLNLLMISVKSTGLFLYKILRSEKNIMSLLIIFGINCLIICLYEINRKQYIQSISFLSNHPFIRTPLRKIILFLSLSFIFLFASFVPAAYGMSTTPPDRTLILPSIILTLFIAIGGSLTGRSFSHRYRTDWIKSRFTGWVFFVCFTLFIFTTTSFILSPVDDYRFFATRFDRADKLIREAKSQGLTTVKVPEVHNHFGLSDYGAGTTYWLDEAVHSYYGIDVIVNKHMK